MSDLPAKNEQVGRVINYRTPDRKPKTHKRVGFFFLFMLGISALSVAICGAFFSVRGISLLFSGSMTAVVIMASGLEFGKLMAATYLHRFWKTTNFLMKWYLTAAVVVLMLITSLGIYGFLSDAYEKTRTDVELFETQIAALEARNVDLDNSVKAAQSQSSQVVDRVDTTVDDLRKLHEEFLTQQDNRIAALKAERDVLDQEVQKARQVLRDLENSRGGLFSSKKSKVAEQKLVVQQVEESQQSSRERIITTLGQIDAEKLEAHRRFTDKVSNYQERTIDAEPDVDTEVIHREIDKNRKEIVGLEKQIANTDIGSFKFIARSFNADLDTVVKWFIFTIVGVFDPLSICLVLAYNSALASRQK